MMPCNTPLALRACPKQFPRLPSSLLDLQRRLCNGISGPLQYLRCGCALLQIPLSSSLPRIYFARRGGILPGGSTYHARDQVGIHGRHRLKAFGIVEDFRSHYHVTKELRSSQSICLADYSITFISQLYVVTSPLLRFPRSNLPLTSRDKAAPMYI